MGRDRRGRRALVCALCALASAALLVPSEAAAGTPYGSRPMKEGTRGHDVSVLQKFLTRLGFATPRTGYYGRITTRSVKRLEKRREWRRDGRVSRKQAEKIRRLVQALPRSVGVGTRFYFFGTTMPGVTLSGEGDSAQVEVRNSADALVATIDVPLTDGSGTAIWNGRRSDGKPAPDGEYLLTTSGSAQLSGGQTSPFDLRAHIFPIRGEHSFGGPGSRFGASRGDHVHQGQDMAAACGTPLVAAQGGTVLARSYQAGGAGYYIVIRGKGSGKDYVYMHMIGPGPLSKGDKVRTGGRIGKVGTTGSSTGCHLHFERWTKPGWFQGGHPYDPLPSLKYWDSYS
jgi:murein DD-endopeptidase MepM/ murein hydrolase activator NlpD